MTDEIPSPCIGICRLDKEKRFCIGCFRTIQEIGIWREMKPDVKRAVIEALPYRKRLYEHSD